ncbi:MAG: hypothetical protein JJE39_17830 [Vicinamibacteria bacterium]|nr:hypothetical protein [Vicinamibacteria bacterium]
MKIRLILVLGVVALASLSAAQIDPRADPAYLESIYGPVVDVGLTDLAFSPESYSGRALRVKGRVGIQGISGDSFELSEAGARITIIPFRRGMNEDEITNLSGQIIEVTGLFPPRSGGAADQVAGGAGTIVFWRWLGPPEKVNKKNAAIITLEQLVGRDGKMDGQLVRVVGKFRGRNLFADLPSRSMRTANDWVVKDDLYAVWVTNRKPKGDGFELDPAIRRDTNRWVEVIGRPTTKKGVVIIDASEVSLTQPPTPKADAAPPPPPPERAIVPPMIVFSLPLDGESDFDFSGQITVQFNNDMDETTFKGRVGLRYEGAPQPGDPGFEFMRISYNPGSKALIVDPGAPILRDRILDLVLLTGILDVDGQPLVRRDGKPAQKDIAEVLRFRE